MLGFLQGFSYGLFLSCLPWFLIGMIDPRLAVPSEPPTRWRAILRYWFVVPFVAFSLWLTSLWGGFHPSFLGWMAGLAGVAIEIPAERGWRRWEARRAARRRQGVLDEQSRRARTEAERHAREQGVAVLDPRAPPPDADRVVQALCRAKARLTDVNREDLAVQADRLYARYSKALAALDEKFDVRELTSQRSRSMVADVCRGAIDNLETMQSLAAGVLGIDADFVRRRLAGSGRRLDSAEREALQQRLTLVSDTERRLDALTARNEAALTSLDNAVVVMARVRTDRHARTPGIERALADLQGFLDRAERYEHEA